jgi:hypothetical protein
LVRVEDIARLRVGRVKVAGVPVNRMKLLARYGLGSKAPALARMEDPKKTATLVAVLQHLEAVAIDDALDLFALLMATRLFSTARRVSAGERLAMLPKAGARLADAGAGRTGAGVELELVEEVGADLDVAALWAAVEEVASREQVRAARDPSQQQAASVLHQLPFVSLHLLVDQRPVHLVSRTGDESVERCPHRYKDLAHLPSTIAVR